MTIRPDLFAGVLPFVRTAEERSFGRAAASLGITTAAVSKAVRKLEDDLGVKLLDRSSRSVAVTREGAIFLERCRHAVLGVVGAREAMDEARREPQGELAVTLPFILAPFVAGDLVRLGAQHPKLSFRLHVSDRMARLGDESFDVAIRVGDLSSSGLVARKLRETRWVTVAAPSYLRRRTPPATPAELAVHDCLRFLGSSGKPREWEFSDGDRAVAGSLVCDHGEYLLAAAMSGMGVCQVLDFMVAQPLRDGALVELLPAFAARGPAIHALSTASRARSANVRAFLRFLVEAFSR
jgi:DNA-binding transcriptional LysR family regulator